jgi:hypothetical protein
MDSDNCDILMDKHYGEDFSINENAKIILITFVKDLIEFIVKKLNETYESSENWNEKSLIYIVKLLPEAFQQFLISEIEKGKIYCEKYRADAQKTTTISLTKLYTQLNNNVSDCFLICCALIIEYLCMEFLDISTRYKDSSVNIIITKEDMESLVFYDKDIQELLKIISTAKVSDNIIQKFCENLDVNLLDTLSDESQQFFIDGAYTCLFQKYGNKKVAKIVLQYFKEIINVADSWVYRGSYKLHGYQALKRTGVMIIPVIPKEEIRSIRAQFLDTIRNFQEYKRNPSNIDQDSTGNNLVYTLGGFAALGNPSSFHNELVRDLRKRCRLAVIPYFREMINNYADKTLYDDTKLEMLFDRMMYRNISQAPSAESWHRDVTPKNFIRHNDEVFGGWINLDETDQSFSCIPGSHLDVRLRDLKEGYTSIPKDKVKLIGSYSHEFFIPPGHMIIFPQYIVHEAVAKKRKTVMMRLFTGWRTTVSNNFLFPDTLKRLEEQSIMRLPSGNEPPMYSSNHRSAFLRKQFKPIPAINHKVNLIEWSRDTFHNYILVDLPKNKPEYKIVKRDLESLKHYGLKMYPKWTKEEIELYPPCNITRMK